MHSLYDSVVIWDVDRSELLALSTWTETVCVGGVGPTACWKPFLCQHFLSIHPLFLHASMFCLSHKFSVFSSLFHLGKAAVFGISAWCMHTGVWLSPWMNVGLLFFNVIPRMHDFFRYLFVSFHNNMSRNSYCFTQSLQNVSVSWCPSGEQNWMLLFMSSWSFLGIHIFFLTMMKNSFDNLTSWFPSLVSNIYLLCVWLQLQSL